MIDLKDIKCKCGSRKITLKPDHKSHFSDWLALCPDCREFYQIGLARKKVITGYFEKQLKTELRGCFVEGF